MRLSSLPVVLATLLGLSGGKLAAQATPGEGDRAPSLALTHVTVIDGTGADPRPDMTVLIENGEILDLFPTEDRSVPESFQRLDLSGRHLIPGLVNTHLHLLMLALTPSRTVSRDQAIRSLERMLYSGVTTIREAAGDTRVSAELSRAALAGEPMPSIYFAARFAGPGFYEGGGGSFTSLGYEPGTAPWAQAVTEETDLSRAVARAAGSGATGIKIYADMDADLVGAMVQEAHRQGLQAWAHATVFPAGPTELVRSGVDVLSHACFIFWGLLEEPPARMADRRPFDPALVDLEDDVYQELFREMNARIHNSHGSIEPGKVADLVILSADPTEDIGALRSVFGVVKNGVFYRTSSGRAQTSLPVLDMHLHAPAADSPPVALCPPFENLPVWDPAEEYSWEIMLEVYADPECENPLESPATDEGVMRGTILAMQRHNVFGVLSGSPERVAAWRAAAPDRFIPAIQFDPVDDPEITPDSLRHLVETGKVAVFGEITGQYEGLAPNDERMEPYWALAEELDIPVAIHMGKAAPGVFYMGDSGYRGRLSSALLLEEVLVRHPRLRVYIMHAGYPRLDDLLTLLYDHPQVHVDIGAFWSEPRAGFYRYLEAIVDAGFGKRVMYGSDQMVWPGAIELTINAIEEAPFLSPAQRRDILYDNAARFLRLSEEDIARHHGR